ncbi:P-loop containing nucleoside triphosphate hydrolase protein [Hymenopellis radicata]|nr:P-loop containing nucleoside triphosphate hydrolase protein [Hymenopellis radicata]
MCASSRDWIDVTLRTACNVEKLRVAQLDLAEHIYAGTDVFCTSATGSGKTIPLQSGPLLAHARGERGIAILVVPTKVLAEQHEEVANRWHLRALAINEDTVRRSRVTDRDLFRELAEGTDVRVGIMTPQMLASEHMSSLFKQQSFLQQLRWFLVDEVHLFDEKESVFAVPYQTLSLLRVRMLPSVIWVSVTATATPDQALHIARRLGYRPSQYINARYPIDRPNLKYFPCFYNHPTSSTDHLDFSFLIPFGLTSAEEIKPTILFARTVDRGYSIMHFLDNLIPHSIPNRHRLIKLFNSIMPADYRKGLKRDFKSGAVRIIIITETAAYGFDVPNARQVVVTDLCYSYAELQQILGRGGRDDEPTRVYSFAPTWLREVPAAVAAASIQGKKDMIRRAGLPPVMVEFYNPTPRRCSRAVECHHNGEALSTPPNSDCCYPIHDPGARDEDLRIVAQWSDFLSQRQLSVPGVPRLITDRTFRALEPSMKDSLRLLLDRWRHKEWASIRPNRNEPCENFLPRGVLDRVVARSHLCSTLPRLCLIAEGWEYADTHGQLLLAYLHTVLKGFNDIFAQRRVEESDDESASEDEGRTLSLEEQYLRDHATNAVLSFFCRENGDRVSGTKPELLERVLDFHVKAGTPVPGESEIARAKSEVALAKAEKMNTDTVPGAAVLVEIPLLASVNSTIPNSRV